MSARTVPVDLQRGPYFEGVIDIYVGNDRVDLAEAKRLGVRAVFYRTSVGLVDKHDDRVAYHAAKKKALEIGLLWGAYHVVSPKPAREQIDRLLEIEDGTDARVAVALDWEKTSEGEIDARSLREFVAAFETRTSFAPILYAGHEVREDKVIARGDPVLARCPLWYVRHAASEEGLEIPAKTWPSFTLWQFDDEKRSNGSPYPADVLPGADFNRFTGTEADLAREWPFRGSIN